ncbi:MAG: DEAD/DEAH box helicase [Planctomycetota bacterium]
MKKELSFDDLGLRPEVLASIHALGYEHPTPIQRLAIPRLLDGHDLIGKAETGTGKTLAFCAPVISHIDCTRVSIQALVLCPTRELAQQVEEVANAVGRGIELRTALVVGGVHQSRQLVKLRAGAQLVVGTPGRVLDMIKEKYLKLGWCRSVVLDEADRMLDMGFIDEVMAIIHHVPSERHMMLFSATIPPRLEQLTREIMHDPMTVETQRGTATVKKISQHYVELGIHDKEAFLRDLLDRYPEDTCIVFCNRKRDVVELDRTLWGLGYAVGSLHGDQEQEKRFKVFDAFKAREIKALVATDVAARGLDIEQVTRIINFDVPDEVDTYVHRIGRTGRAGEDGIAIVLVTAKDRKSWSAIAADPKLEIKRMEWKRGAHHGRAEPTALGASITLGRDSRHRRTGAGRGKGGGGVGRVTSPPPKKGAPGGRSAATPSAGRGEPGVGRRVDAPARSPTRRSATSKPAAPSRTVAPPKEVSRRAPARRTIEREADGPISTREGAPPRAEAQRPRHSDRGQVQREPAATARDDGDRRKRRGRRGGRGRVNENRGHGPGRRDSGEFAHVSDDEQL